MVAFQALGSRRVARAVSEFFQPATTVVLRPSFFRAMSTTALGGIAGPGSDPAGHRSVRVGPGHSASTEMPSLRSSLASPSANTRDWAIDPAELLMAGTPAKATAEATTMIPPQPRG